MAALWVRLTRFKARRGIMQRVLDPRQTMASDKRANAAHRLLQRFGPWHCSIKRWASKIPTEPALVWLNGQADIVVQKTYGELHSAATKLAEKLNTLYGCKPRDRLILCYPPGVDFVVAFVACQMLGAAAVPVYFPTHIKRSNEVHSFISLIRKARASQFLLTSSVCKQSGLLEWDLESTGMTPRWIFSDELIQEFNECNSNSAPTFDSNTEVSPTDVAFMQFSSGSMGTPKGCLITQAGFLHNIHHNWYMSGIYCSTRKQVIYDIPLEEYVDFTEDFQQLALQRWGHRLRFVSWLPVTHDMGLVGMIGVPLFFGCTAYLMSPLEFLRNPAVWLEAFSRHQCSVTAAPDFAYSLATRKVPDAALQGLSLGKALAFINGAEPIRQRTLEQFACVGSTPEGNAAFDKFERCGFERWMMCPAYGLAENTVGVTGRGHDGMWPRVPRVLKVSRDKLFPGDMVCPIFSTEPRKTMASLRSIVGCGCPHGDVIVKIVHPEVLVELPEWHVGEVWISSPSCALAYFDDPVSTGATFQVEISGVSQKESASKYLRTGDLGFVADGELYITGRLKNVLIIRGKNYYLQDFEEVVEACPQIRKGCVMAFAAGDDAEDLESLGIAAELERGVILPAEAQPIANQVRRSILRAFGLPVRSLWLTEAGILPKTTSGKPRRHAAKVMLESGLCQGVIYCSVCPERHTARTHSQRTECSNTDNPEDESVGVEVERCSNSAAPQPNVLNPPDAESRQKLAGLSSLHCQEHAMPAERGKPNMLAATSVEKAVFESFKEVFKSSDIPVNDDTPLEAFSVDSLSAVELATALTTRLNVKVEPFAFFDCTNIGSVVSTMRDILSHKNKAYHSPARHMIEDSQPRPQDEIYITGMACILPRGCDSTADFWKRLLQRDEFISRPPRGRCPRLCGHVGASTAVELRHQSEDWQGGFIADISLFDNVHFGISAAEAAAMDPQQRLLLMQTVEALSSRGDSVSSTGPTGVFVGCCSEDWQRLTSADKSQAFTAIAQSGCMLANRISYSLNFTGPSVTVDTACSSSLVALHCAWQELTTCRSNSPPSIDTAVVAAVNLMMVFDTTLALQRSGFLSPSFRCRTFDAAADGFVRSEGTATVILERIPQEGSKLASAASSTSPDDAGCPAQSSGAAFWTGSKLGLGLKPAALDEFDVRWNRGSSCPYGEDEGITRIAESMESATGAQGDHGAAPKGTGCCRRNCPTQKSGGSPLGNRRQAWCRLVASAVVHGGKTASVTAPCRASQEQLYRRVLSVANAVPEDISYIETHGTGTALGDPIEVAAIVSVFKTNSSSRSSPLILGAVKTNLGHLEGAAGMAGLLKSALCLAHDKVPANLHLKTLNPYIDFQQLPVVLPCKTMPLTFRSHTCCTKMRGPSSTNTDHSTTLVSGTPNTSVSPTVSRCIVTSLGFGGTYAQAVLQSIPSSALTVEEKSLAQETPRKYPWELKRFDHSYSCPPEAALSPSAVFPAYCWRVAWELHRLDDSPEFTYGMSWRAPQNWKSCWLILSCRNLTKAYWKTLDLRDVQVVVQTVSADVSEESLQCLLQSKVWQAIVFMDGVEVYDSSTAVGNFLWALCVVPLCGKLLAKIHPHCKMLLLTRGSQIVQNKRRTGFFSLENAQPHAAGLLGFTRACRAELSYTIGRSPLLYFVDLDPSVALNSSLNLLAGTLQKFKTDELDLAIRHGDVYAQKLFHTGPLPSGSLKTPEDTRFQTDQEDALSVSLSAEETAISSFPANGCPLRSVQCQSRMSERNTRQEERLASSCGRQLAPCACLVRMMSVCASSLTYNSNGQRESSDLLIGCSGIIVAVGDQVEHLKVGDAVCGFVPSPFRRKPALISISCSRCLQPVPPSMSFEAAAAIPTQLAQIMRIADLRTRHCYEGTCTTPRLLKNTRDPLHGTQESSLEPCTDPECAKKDQGTRDSSNGTSFLVGNLADGSRASTCSVNTGSCRHQGNMELSGVPLYKFSSQLTSMPQSTTPPCVADGRESQGRRAGQEAETQEKEMHLCPHLMNVQDSSLPTARVEERDVMSHSMAQTSYVHPAPTDLVLVDGSGAGLTAANYFRDMGYFVLGVPSSQEQLAALEMLEIHVIDRPGVYADAEEGDSASGAKVTPGEVPCAESDAGVMVSPEGSATYIRTNVAGDPAPARAALKAATNTPAMARKGTACQNGKKGAVGAHCGNGAVPAGATPEEETSEENISESGTLWSSEKSALAEAHHQNSYRAGQPQDFPAPTDFHGCPASGRVCYCTLRSQKGLGRLLPWMVKGSIICDFSSVCSTAEEMKKWFQSHTYGVRYWNAAADPAADSACSTLSQLQKALRNACNLLKGGPSCYPLINLYVFHDASLDNGTAYVEACDFTDSTAHAGFVVCTYSSPILHVPSLLVSSPAGNQETSHRPPAVPVDGNGVSARGEPGAERNLLALLATGFSHTTIERMRQQEICGVHCKECRDSPDAKQKNFFVSSGSTGQRGLLSIEERRNISYIVSGDPRGLSAAVARWLVEEGALHVVLLHEDGIEGHMEEDGDWKWLRGTNTRARILPVPCDLQSKDSIQKALRHIYEELHFPPLRGIIHVTCDVPPVLSGNMDNATGSSRYVLEHKALAAWNLHYALDELNMEDCLQFFVLFSGISGLFGSVKRGAACAANTMLDMLATYRSSQGLSGLSIQWSSWQANTGEVGGKHAHGAALTCESEPMFVAWLNKEGISGILDGFRSLREILTLYSTGQLGAVVACFGAGPASTGANLKGDRGWIPRLGVSLNKQHFETPSDTVGRPVEVVRASGVALTDDSWSDHKDVLYELVYKEVCTLVAFYVQMEKGQQLRPDEPLSSLGLDSLTAAEFKYELQSRFRLEFNSQMIQEQATIESIASSIFSHLSSQFSSSLSGSRPNTTRESIAVVSMALRLPGGCYCPSTFWGMLLAGTDCSKVFRLDQPAKRDLQALHTGTSACTSTTTRTCQLDSAYTFGSDFFNLRDSESLVMNTEARLLSDVAYEALFNINIRDLSHCGLPVAVYATGFAQSKNSAARQSLKPSDCIYHRARITRQAAPVPLAKLVSLPPEAPSQETLPSLISYQLSLSGMSVSVSAGDASSLAALCLAADHLGTSTDTEAALVGGVRLLPLELQNFPALAASLQRLSVANIDFCCDQAIMNDSFHFESVEGEGAMAVVLQKQKLAEMSANPVLAIIRGRGLAHVGRRSKATTGECSYTGAFRSVLRSALASAGAKPKEVALVEVAGVGSASDMHHAEWDAIAAVYGGDRLASSAFPIVVSSIKGNVGCLREAAGLAGFLKVVLMLAQSNLSQRGGCVVVPPSLRLEKVCKSVRDIAANSRGGVLFPSRTLVRRLVPSTAASAEGRPGSRAVDSISSSNTLLQVSGKSLQNTKVSGTAPSLSSLWHPHEVTSCSTRESYALTSSASACPLPAGTCSTESLQRAVLCYSREDRTLGGVTASAQSGFVVHVLLEGAASTLDPTILPRGKPSEENSVQHLHTLAARDPLAPTVGGGACKPAPENFAVVNAVDGAPVQVNAGCSRGVVGNGKRCLWLFTNDYSDLLYCARPLYFTSKIFAQELDRCSQLMCRHLPSSLRQLLYPVCEAELQASEKLLSQPRVAQLSLFALQWSLASYLRQTAQGRLIGVTGVGVGETVAAAVAGLLSIDEAITLVIQLENTKQSHTHTHDVHASTTLSCRAARADCRLPCTQPSYSQNHTCTGIDYGLSTDGEQSNRSDCFSLYDDTDASCRSLCWRNDMCHLSRTGRLRTQPQQPGFGVASLSLEYVEQSAPSQRQMQQLQPFANVSGVSAAQSRDNADVKPNLQKQASGVGAPFCPPVPDARRREFSRDMSPTAAETGAGTSVTLSATSAVRAPVVETSAHITAAQTVSGQDGIRGSYATPANMIRREVTAESSAPPAERAAGFSQVASSMLEAKHPKTQVTGSPVEETRRRSCCLSARSLTTPFSSIYDETKMYDQKTCSPSPILRRREGSLVDLTAVDTPHGIVAPSCYTPIPLTHSSSFSELVDSIPPRKASVDDFLCNVDNQENDPHRRGRRRRSRINSAELPPTLQSFTPTPMERRSSLMQHTTPTHANFFSLGMKTARFLNNGSLTGDKRIVTLNKQADQQTVGHMGSSAMMPGRVAEHAFLQENKLCCTPMGATTALRLPLISHQITAIDTPSARSSLLYTFSRKDLVFASLHDSRDASCRSFTTTNAGIEAFGKARPQCQSCEEIRSIVGRISMQQATCVFLSSVLATAAPDRLLRDPLYWCPTSPQKLRLRTTVKVAKKVLRAAAVVTIGPPASGTLHPASLVKLTKHLDILRFTGRSDSPEAVIPCEVSTCTERAAAVSTDIVLRVPHATPCWNNQNTGSCKLHGICFPPLTRLADQSTRRTASRHQRDSRARLWTSLSD